MNSGTREDLERLITERLGRPGWQGSHELLIVRRDDEEGFSISEMSLLGVIPEGTDILHLLSHFPAMLNERPPVLVQAGFWGLVLTGTTAYVSEGGSIAPVRMAFACGRTSELPLAVMTDTSGIPLDGPMGMMGGEHLPLLLGRILACILARCC